MEFELVKVILERMNNNDEFRKLMRESFSEGLSDIGVATERSKEMIKEAYRQKEKHGV